MDHYNATVHNGNLVSTRRGLHVSKTKHQGTRFVNTFAAPSEPEPGPSSSSSPSANASTPSSSAGSFLQFQLDQPRSKTRQDKLPPGHRKTRAAGRKVLGKPPKVKSETSLPALTNSSRSVADSEDSGYLEFPHRDPSSWARLTCGNFFDISPASFYQPKHWKATPSQEGTSELTQKLTHLYLKNTPCNLFPNEELMTYNPLRAQDSFERINSSVIKMQSVILATTLLNSIDKREATLNQLQFYVTKVCAAVHQRLQDHSREPGSELSTMEAISSMAICELFTVQFDHWHVHMRGLKSVIDSYGGMKAEWGASINKLRKSDVKGSLYTESTPYLEFRHYLPHVSNVLAPDVRHELTLKSRRLLGRACVCPRLTDTFVNMLLFQQTVKLVRKGDKKTLLLDPLGFVEEYAGIEYQLALYPSQIAADEREAQLAYQLGCVTPSNFQLYTSPEQTYDSFSSEGDVAPIAFEPRTPEPNLLDCTLRIGMILFMEEIMTEPRPLDPYGLPLARLNQNLRDTVARLRNREDAFLAGQMPVPQSGYMLSDGLPSDITAARPILLWSCVVAYAIIHVLEGGMPGGSGNGNIDREPYQNLVVLLLGGSSPEAVDALSVDDLELCDLVETQQMEAVYRDARTILKDILAHYEARELMAIAPYL